METVVQAVKVCTGAAPETQPKFAGLAQTERTLTATKTALIPPACLHRSLTLSSLAMKPTEKRWVLGAGDTDVSPPAPRHPIQPPQAGRKDADRGRGAVLRVDTRMQAVSGFRCREQGEHSLQQLMPRMGRVPGAGGTGPHAAGLQGPHRASKPPRELSMEEQQELRRKINSRERKRMQDLNVAMDALREVMVPYSSSPTSVGGALQHPYLPPGAPPTGRRLSKISTLVLARNYILLLGSSLQEMRRLLGEVSIGMGVTGTVPRLLLAGGWPFLTGPGQILFSNPEQQLGPAKCPLLPQNSSPVQEEPSVWGSGSISESLVCQCGMCRTPRVLHVNPVTRFPK